MRRLFQQLREPKKIFDTGEAPQNSPKAHLDFFGKRVMQFGSGEVTPFPEKTAVALSIHLFFNLCVTPPWDDPRLGNEKLANLTN